MKKLLDRRDFIKASGLSLGLPWLEYFAGQQALAADAGLTSQGVPKRLFIVFNGLGTIPNEWCDINSNGTAVFKKILKPLEKHRERMTIIRGLTHAANGGTHEAVELAALTGQPYVGDRKTTKFAAGISIDQHIANVIGANTVRKSISLSIQGKNQYNPLSHFGHSQPNFPIKNPYTAFDQILSNIGKPNGSMMTREDQLQKKREQVLKHTHERYKELFARLGQDDKLRLEAHLESLNSLIKTLDLQQQVDQGGSHCAVSKPSKSKHSLLPESDASSKFLTEEYRYGVADLDRNQDIIKAYMDIGAQAFSCDVSRVVALDQGHFHRHGSASHKVDVNNRSVATAEYDEVLNAGVRCAQNINYLVDQLVSTPDGQGGNLMDSSLIYWMQSHQDGKNHTLNNCTDVLIGNAGGMFNTNRSISINPKDNRRHTELLTSIANCFGLPDSGFGKIDWRGEGRIHELGIRV